MQKTNRIAGFGWHLTLSRQDVFAASSEATSLNIPLDKAVLPNSCIL
jgi:hypothetical protein